MPFWLHESGLTRRYKSLSDPAKLVMVAVVCLMCSCLIGGCALYLPYRRQAVLQDQLDCLLKKYRDLQSFLHKQNLYYSGISSKPIKNHFCKSLHDANCYLLETMRKHKVRCLLFEKVSKKSLSRDSAMYAKTRYNLKFTGSFDCVVAFLQALQEHQTIFAFSSCSISSESGATVVVDAVLSVFISPGENK